MRLILITFALLALAGSCASLVEGKYEADHFQQKSE